MSIIIQNHSVHVSRTRITSFQEEVLPDGIELPIWLETGYLGEFLNNSGEDINIPLLFDDPSNIITGFVLLGKYPNGIAINQLSGNICGSIATADLREKNYTFRVAIRSLYGSVSSNFSIKIYNEVNQVKFITPHMLGTYSIGEEIDTEVEAESSTIRR